MTSRVDESLSVSDLLAGVESRGEREDGMVVEGVERAERVERYADHLGPFCFASVIPALLREAS